MQTIPSCSHLSDAALRAELPRAAHAERATTVHVIALLAEFDQRRLYFAEGYKSLFLYCTDALHFSESAAYSRIQAARAARKWPGILEALAEGSVTLTTVGLLAPHFTDANCAALLAEARHKRKTDVELIVARLNPQPDAPSVVRKMPSVSSSDVTPLQLESPDCVSEAAPAPRQAAAPAPPRPIVTPLAPERYKIQITVDQDTRDVLRQAQDLMRHSNPSGDPAVIISRALRVLVDDLLKKKSAATDRPGRTRGLIDGSRAIPAGVKRAVWQRDAGRCAFEGPRGRCNTADGIEYHHVIPYAMGGEATVDNVELRCRAHNAYQATLDGLGWDSTRREAAP